MQKILTLDAKQFFQGLALGAHTPSSGIFLEAIGANPFINPTTGSVDAGLLQINASQTEVGAVVDTPFASTSRATGAATGTGFVLGTSGHLYTFNALNFSSLSDKRSGTPITDPASGLFIFQAAGGAEYLYYLQKAQVGQWNMVGTYATGWTDNFATGLQSTTVHPVHRFGDRVYIADMDRISMFYDNAGTPTLSLNVLDFPTGYYCNCLEDDGVYLIAGITRNQGDSLIYADTKIIFWDTNISTWNREWSIPDPNITCIKRIGTFFLALGTRGVYMFSFDSPPQKIRTLGTATVPSPGYPNTIGQIGGAGVWGGGGAYMTSFGKFIEEAPNAFLKPFAGFDAQQTLIATDIVVGSILVGTAGPKLWQVSVGAGGGTGSPQTIYFDLGALWQIQRIDVIFGRKLANGDAFDIDVKLDESTSAIDWGAISFATHGAIRRKQLFAPKSQTIKSVITDQLSLVLNYTGGNVKIKRIDVYGEPVTK